MTKPTPPETPEQPNSSPDDPSPAVRDLLDDPNILKRVLIHVAGFNLGLVMRQATGVGKPRGLQGHSVAALAALRRLLATCNDLCRLPMRKVRLLRWNLPPQPNLSIVALPRWEGAFTTGC